MSTALLMALGLNTAGVLLLYRAWQAAGRARRALAAGGWALLALAFAAFARDSGMEFAGVYVAIATALLAWGLVGWSSELRTQRLRPARAAANAEAPPTRARSGRLLARVLLVGPLAGLAWMPLGLALTGILPGAPADRLALGFFALLLGWTLTSLWFATSARLAPPALACAGLAAAGTALVWVAA